MTDDELNDAVAKEVMGFACKPVRSYVNEIGNAFDVVTVMSRLDWRLTLMAPGGFTDEGLGGGHIDGRPWRAFFQRPDPPLFDDEELPEYYDRIADYYNTSGENDMNPARAICLAALKAVRGMKWHSDTTTP